MIEISILQDGDEATLNAVCDLNCAFANESGSYSKMGVNPDKVKAKALEYLAHGYIIIAKDGDRVIGYSPCYAETEIQDRVNFEISTFYVHPDYRNSGVGGMMIEKLKEIMDSLNFGMAHIAICAEIDDNLQRATELLFKRGGFEQIGTVYARKGF